MAQLVHLDEPAPRSFPFSAIVDDKFYIWGGKPDKHTSRAELVSTVKIFDLHREKWSSTPLKGYRPSGFYDGSTVTKDHCLYTFGGNNGVNLYEAIHMLDVRTLTWSQLSACNELGRPTKEDWRCKMLYYKDRLVLFGSTCSRASDVGTRTQSSDLYTFDLKTRKWSKPMVTGKPPPVTGDFSLTMIDEHRAVMFGGYLGKPGYTNDTYILDLKRMEWSMVEIEEGAPRPPGSSDHVALCLGYGEDNPQLLIHGGICTKVLSDMWVLDIATSQWQKVSLPKVAKLPRHAHCICALKLSPSLTKIVLFGGHSIHGNVANTAVYIVERQENNLWHLTDVAVGDQQGTAERIESLELKITEDCKSSKLKVSGSAASHASTAAAHAMGSEHGQSQCVSNLTPESGAFKVQFNPSQPPDSYKLDVAFNDQDIKGSPFNISVAPSAELNGNVELFSQSVKAASVSADELKMLYPTIAAKEPMLDPMEQRLDAVHAESDKPILGFASVQSSSDSCSRHAAACEIQQPTPTGVSQAAEQITTVKAAEQILDSTSSVAAHEPTSIDVSPAGKDITLIPAAEWRTEDVEPHNIARAYSSTDSEISEEDYLLCYSEGSEEELYGVSFQGCISETEDEEQRCRPESPAALEMKNKHRDACKKAISEKSTVPILAVRLNYVGLPRSGKTYFRRRLTGEIKNIAEDILRNGLKKQRSTGAVEEGGHILITDKATGRDWSLLDLDGEASLLNQFIQQAALNNIGDSAIALDPTVLIESSSTELSLFGKVLAALKRLLSYFFSSPSPPPESEDDHDMEEVFAALETEGWDTVKVLLEDLILLITTDTGGQAEFLDLQASFVQGPSFNLLFSRLTHDLDSVYDDYFTNEEGVSTIEEFSTMTAEEVLFQALSTIACSSGFFSESTLPSTEDESLPFEKLFSKSKVMFVGTFRDELETEEDFKRKDKCLQQMVKNTEFYSNDIIEYASKDDLMLAVDNMHGGEEEIQKIRNILEKIIKRSFKKIDIPVAWLLLSLCIRKRKRRTMKLPECEMLARKLGIHSEELQVALWFLHCLGILLYFPEVELLKDTIICEMQVLFDCTSNLVKNTFVFDAVGKRISTKFQEEAQFSLSDMKKASMQFTDDLTLEQLIALLDHLNILTVIPPILSSSEDTRSLESHFFMPCVLKIARANELLVTTCDKDPAPLILHFNCGFVPVGMFPAIITNLVSQQQKEWRRISENLRKNRVPFFVGSDCDEVILISHPRYLEIVISRRQGAKVPTKCLCSHVRNVIQSTVDAVTSRTLKTYGFDMKYKLGFECDLHHDVKHPCLLEPSTTCMQCLVSKDMVPLGDRQLEWFSDSSDQISSFGTSTARGVSLSLKSLDIIKWTNDNGDKEFFCLSEMVDSRWRDFGLYLNFLTNQLDGWEREKLCNPTACWFKVMENWLSGSVSSEYEVSWDGLYELLEDLKLKTVAERLKIAVDSAIPSITIRSTVKFIFRFLNLKVLICFVPLLVIKLALLWFFIRRHRR